MGMAEVNVDASRIGSLARGRLRPALRPARYGEFRVDAASGEAVLVGLRDAQLKGL
jgi:hypothetical protein